MAAEYADGARLDQRTEPLIGRCVRVRVIPVFRGPFAAPCFCTLNGLQEGNYDKTYYLEPGEGGAKAYALLRRAMEETGRIAIARVVIRSKESLAAIRVFKNGVLAMETMHFPDEVRSPAGLTGIVEPEIRAPELEMATNLVASLSSGDFTPEKFQNEYRQSVLDLIAARVAGEEVVQVEQPVERGRVVDLMEALRASIRRAETERGEVPEAAAPAVAPVGAGPAAPATAPALPGPATAPRVTPGVPGMAPGLVPGIPSPAPAPAIPGLAAAPAPPGVPGIGPVPGAPAPAAGGPNNPALGPRPAPVVPPIQPGGPA